MIYSTSNRALTRLASISLAIFLLAATPSESNSNPMIDVDPPNPVAGQDVMFTAIAEGVRFEWDFDDDGQTDAMGQEVTTSFDCPGTYPITLTVFPEGLGQPKMETEDVEVAPDGELSFTKSVHSVNESDGMASIEVRRTGGASCAASARCDSSDGTASAPDDYTATMDLLEWPAQVTASRFCTVPIVNDTLPEGNETFNLTLTNFEGVNMGSAVDAEVTIIDDDEDPGELSFTRSTYAVNENAGMASIEVRRTGGSSGEVSVRCDTSNGSATAPDDYAVTRDTLVWPDGETGNRECTVPINNDSEDESNETVNLTLTNFVGAGMGSPIEATLTIIDNDEAGDLSFTSPSYPVGEDDGMAVITVERTGGSDGEISVRCDTTDGTATAGEDYTVTQETLTWTNGDTNDKQCMVPILDNNEEEADEAVNLALTNFTGSAGMGNPITATLTIMDDDEAGDLSFTSSSYTAREEDVAMITVQRTGGSDGQISVRCDTTDDTAIAPDDYTRTMDVLTWEHGDDSNKNCTVPIVDDTLEETDETVDLTLTNFGGPAGMGDPIAAVLTIIDNDLSIRPRAELIIPGFQVAVDEPSGTTTLFAVRNTSEGSIRVQFDYHGHKLANMPLRTATVELNPHETMAMDVRSDLSDLDVVDGFASGLVLISEVDKGATSNLVGDYFQIDFDNNFAGGDRLVRPPSLCTLQEMRFVDFGSGVKLRVLVNKPLGVSVPSFTYTAYDQSGALIADDMFFTSDHLNILDLTHLEIDQGFGTLLFDFSNSNGGWVGARFSAFGRFSVDLASACRED